MMARGNVGCEIAMRFVDTSTTGTLNAYKPDESRRQGLRISDVRQWLNASITDVRVRIEDSKAFTTCRHNLLRAHLLLYWVVILRGSPPSSMLLHFLKC